MKVAAFLDASVLYPPMLRSLLMYLAATRVFKALWSEQVQDEWIRAVLRNNPDVSAAALARTRAMMTLHVDGAVVTGYEPLIAALTLPDPNDRHVLAAAMHGGAKVIVTNNLRHFPKRVLAPHDIVAKPADGFVCDLIAADAGGVLKALALDRAGLRKPAMTAAEYLDAIQHNGLVQAAARLRPIADRL